MIPKMVRIGTLPALDFKEVQAVFQQISNVVWAPNKPDTIAAHQGNRQCISGKKFPLQKLIVHVIYFYGQFVPQSPVKLLDGTSYSGPVDLISITGVHVQRY